jgi:carboxyl-terminal processing protease
LTPRSRLISAVLVVFVAAGGAAAYARHAAGADAATLAAPPAHRIVANIDLNALLGQGDSPNALIEIAYDNVEREYYKPVADRLLVTGERKALTQYLKFKKVAAPQVAAASPTGDRSRDLALLESTLATTQKRYPTLPRDEMTQAALAGMLGGLGDPYTTYLSPKAIQSLNEQLQGGNFGGIGVYIVQDRKTGEVYAQPIEGNPAIKAGVQVGDSITAVDGHPVTGQPLDKVEGEIRGPKGSVVALTLRHHPSKRVQVVHVVRADVHVPSVVSKNMNGIGYVQLADFGSTSADEVRTAFVNLQKQNVHGYILDLRNNGGGLLDAAVDISSIFIPHGTIVSTINRAGVSDVKSAEGNAIGAKPLVILVNKYTASASEITAGAVQDYGAGTLVGEKTFGKGVVQSIFRMPDNGALKITTGRYLTPKGRDINHLGIVPDVVVPQIIGAGVIGSTHDKQLAAAKRIIEKDRSS